MTTVVDASLATIIRILLTTSSTECRHPGIETSTLEASCQSDSEQESRYWVIFAATSRLGHETYQVAVQSGGVKFQRPDSRRRQPVRTGGNVA